MKKLALMLLSALVLFSFVSCGEADAGEKLVFKVNNMSDPESLDPHKITGSTEHQIYMTLFEGLVTYDPETGLAIPGMAESWTISDSGDQITFNLRDAKWSDGTPVTAQQFVDSWLRFLNPETAAEYAFLTNLVIKGAQEYNAGEAGPEAVQIRALDEKTFQIDLTGPAPYAIDMLTHYAFAVVPLHVIEEFGTDWTRPENIVSNGPFTLTAFNRQEIIVAEKNPMYWDAENVALDVVEYYPINSQMTAQTMFDAGEIDWHQDPPLEIIDELIIRDDYQASPSMIVYFYLINHAVKPLDDARVRRALSLAIDRNELVEQILKAGQTPAFGLVPPVGAVDALPGAINIAEAKALLADAGFPNGEGFPEITVLYNTSEGHKKIAEWVQQEWKEALNIDVQLENQEWSTYLKSTSSGDFQIARAGWQGDYPDPNTFLDMFMSGAEIYTNNYANPEFDALIEEAASMQGGQARFDVLRKAESLLIDEDQAVIPFYYYVSANMIDTSVWGGWYSNVLDKHPVKTIYKK